MTYVLLAGTVPTDSSTTRSLVRSAEPLTPGPGKMPDMDPSETLLRSSHRSAPSTMVARRMTFSKGASSTSGAAACFAKMLHTCSGRIGSFCSFLDPSCFSRADLVCLTRELAVMGVSSIWVHARVLPTADASAEAIALAPTGVYI